MCIRDSNDCLDDFKIKINVRKRSRWTLDETHPPHSLGNGPLMAGGLETDGMSPRNGISPNSTSHALRSEVTDDTVRTTDKQTSNMAPEGLASLPDGHHSGEFIKTEMELVVSL